MMSMSAMLLSSVGKRAAMYEFRQGYEKTEHQS